MSYSKRRFGLDERRKKHVPVAVDRRAAKHEYDSLAQDSGPSLLETVVAAEIVSDLLSSDSPSYDTSSSSSDFSSSSDTSSSFDGFSGGDTGGGGAGGDF